MLPLIFCAWLSGTFGAAASTTPTSLPASGDITLGDYWLKWGKNETSSTSFVPITSNGEQPNTSLSELVSPSAITADSMALSRITVTAKPLPTKPCIQSISAHHRSMDSSSLSAVNWGTGNITGTAASRGHANPANSTSWTQASLKPSVSSYKSTASILQPAWTVAWALLGCSFLGW